ncbi:tRNA1(Val) (adenine(37)-N6)-methyltransferase [Ferruginibacter sp.]
MPNNYFKFKQFTIHQDKCAMKVCTDACLFGAYIANEIQQLPVKNILDIGTGTGLLTLMLAQKTSATIDAVEIDAAAFTQGKQNIEQSPWREKIAIYNSDILQFQTNKKYDCIISNPPFFEADLKSGDEKKNFAKHDTSLTFTELLNFVTENLSPAGFFSVLLPFRRSNYFEAEAAKINFNLIKKILIKQTPKHNHFRSILIFSTKKLETIQEEIIIKNEEGNYSTKFIELLKDYYLHL